MHRHRFIKLICTWALSFLPLAAGAESIKLAVAANFYPVMQDLLGDFNARYPETKVALISGASGKLYAQIMHGAPFDIFLSADQDKPSRLVDANLAVADSQFTYASGQLVLWSRDPDLLSRDATSMLPGGGNILQTDAYRKLAIANAKLAPYGRAAEEVLEKLDLRQRTRHKWVQGENIAQTFQFVESGNAELGFVAKSQIWQSGRLTHGSAWLIPEDWYQPIKQDAVLLTRAATKQEAILLLDFLKQESVRQRIASYGYQHSMTDVKSSMGAQN